MPVLLLGEVVAGDRLPDLAYDVTATTVVLGALASRDWRPMHHDKDFAVDRNGTRDIFFEHAQSGGLVPSVSSPTGLAPRTSGRMTFRMLGSVFPGDTMVLSGVVDEVTVDEAGCGWVASTSPCRWATT